MVRRDGSPAGDGQQRRDGSCRLQSGRPGSEQCSISYGPFSIWSPRTVYGLAEQATGMVRARLLQDAFYLLFFAVAGILIAAILNWRNDKQGYWMNGALIAFADIPFVLFVLVPGLIPWWPGLAGPLLWLIAFAFTSVGRFSEEPNVVAGAAG